MPYFKPFLRKSLAALIMCTVVTGYVGAVASGQVSDCVQEGKEQFSNQQYQTAKETFTRCVQMSPSDAETQLSLAGVLLTLEDLDGAEKAFRTALANMTRTSPYLSYTYSMLGDIALKRQRNDDAFAFYTKSLESNAANVNSLVGKGVIVEYQGDKKSAAGYYRSALAVEPLNLIARQRLVNLEPDYFSDDEILAALKQRYAINPKVTELTDEMRRDFVNIHRAEQRRGVNYLRKKYPKVPTDFIVTINKGTDFEREMLTKAGYEALQKHIGQDAIGVFKKAGVPVKDVFSLRDMKGTKIFKSDSTLTESGFFVYTEALQNRKAFLLPDESVAPSKETLAQIARVEEELKKAGYIEITRKELKFLEKQTKCSEETLRKDLGVYALPINKKTRRYFIIAQQTPDPKKGVPYYYLMKERAKYDKSVKVPSNALVESYAYYGYTICFDDGKMMN